LGSKITERYFSSGENIEEIGHESNLSANVAFPDSFNLSLPEHVHGLIPADGRKASAAARDFGNQDGQTVRLFSYARLLWSWRFGKVLVSV